jgi:phosphatidylglycerophosphatase C
LLTEIVDELVSDVVASHIRKGAAKVIETHRNAGDKLWLASASFDFYVKRLGASLGFENIVCTSAARTPEDALSGTIDGQNCYGRAKVDAVLRAIPDRDNHTLVAYSDHHSDWALLEESDIPVAVNPTRELRRIAEAKKIDIQMW